MGLLPHTEPAAGLRVGVLQARTSVRYGERLGVDGHRVPQAAAVDLPADLPARRSATAPTRGLDAGAQPVHGDQPRLRHVTSSCRRTTTWRRCVDALQFDDDRPDVLAAERGGDPLPVRAARRGPVGPGRGSRASTASSSGSTSERRAAPRRSSSTRRGCASSTTARSTRLRYLDGVFERLSTRCPTQHLGDRDLRPRRAVRRGPLLRPRADRAREGARGPLRRGARPLMAVRTADEGFVLRGESLPLRMLLRDTWRSRRSSPRCPGRTSTRGTGGRASA